MQNFILVSVAIGILSGTTLTATAQSSVNIEHLSTSSEPKNAGKFIEGIEIIAPTAKTANSAKPLSTNEDEVTSIENFTSLQFKYALLLDMEVEAVTNKTLFAEIEKWWGTRYRYGGATDKGIDCSAYTGSIVHTVYGLVLPRTSRAQYADCIKLEKEELQQGDLVFFKTGRGVSHVGLYLTNGYFTHASTSIGVTISNLSETYWSKKYIGGGRIVAPAAPVTE